MQFESETRSAFSQCHTCSIFTELVAMVAEENKVSLIVQGYGPPRSQVGNLWEETSEHTANPMSKHGIEIVHDELRVSISGSRRVIDNVVP